MPSKPDIRIKAAAELELRRRHRVRAAACCMCDFEEMVGVIYHGVSQRPNCYHTRWQQQKLRGGE